MRVIIAGSRHIDDYDLIVETIEKNGLKDKITEVVSGGAAGVDYNGQVWALINGIPIKLFRPDWDLYGKAAGPIRNQEMAKYADALILIWDGESRGSLSMKLFAKDRKIPIYEKIV